MEDENSVDVHIKWSGEINLSNDATYCILYRSYSETKLKEKQKN